MRWPIAIVSALTFAIMMVAVGCAASESAGDDEQAIAVAPEDEQQVSDSEDRADDLDETADAEGPVEESEPVDLIARLSQSRLDSQQFARVADEAPHSGPGQTLGALGLLPDSERCDGEPCNYCELGTEDTFEFEEQSLSARSCCAGEDQCVMELYFGDDDSSVAIVDGAIGEAHFSSDARSVVVSSQARSTGDEEIFFVQLEQLRAMARPIDEGTPVVASGELRDEAPFRLSADAVHRLEALSARAVEEGERECDTGHHLPTLFELSEDAEPLSDSLEITFERWDDDDRLVMSTLADGAGQTTMTVDPESHCMQRVDARG